MTLACRGTRLAAVVLVVVLVFAARPAPAAALNIGPLCSVAGMVSGLIGKGCSLVTGGGGRLISAAKNLFTGHIGSAVKSILGQAGSAAASHASVAVGLAAVSLWVVGGAKFVIHAVAQHLSETTTPRLGATWFSATYWRVAAIGALLTLPFLFAAAVQALVRSDLTLLLRSVLGYLPLAVLMVAIAAPVTMLLLSASDELSSLVSSATQTPGSHAFSVGSALIGVATLASRSLFFAFFFALLTVLWATALWFELLIRDAAVYVVVLMLPLAFAALVWPARRTWAIRSVELLFALILSKFAIVAVLSLGGAAMNQLGHSITTAILGLLLVMMAAVAPWALLRLIPLAEVASAAVGSLRGEALGAPVAAGRLAYRVSEAAADWASATTQSMSRTAERGLLPPGSGSVDDDDDDEDGSYGAGGAPDDPGPGGLEAPLDGEPSPMAEWSSDGPPLPTPDEPTDPAVVGPGGEPSPSPEPQRERIPGLGPMWQAENFSWKPLVLGPHDDGPPRLWPPDPPAGEPQADAGLPGDDTGLLGAGQDALPPAADERLALPPPTTDPPQLPDPRQPPPIEPEPSG
jgi:hypothetical protein